MPLIEYVPYGDYNFSYTAPIPLPWNPTVYCLVAAFSAVPMWMTIELTFQIFATFKRYTGLYFWSLLFCTWCISIRQVGRIVIYFVPGCNQVFSLTFAMLGWVGTVSGFAVVLYSRLHLVTRNRRILRGVLAMIICDVFFLHLPTMVAQIGVVTKIHKNWVSWYPAMEKMQIVGFTVQETIISSIYIWATRKMVHESYNVRTKRTIRLLILVQLICISLDIPFIVLAYTDIFLIKATLTSFAYAIKLKLEFIVLNQLLGIVKHGIAPRGIEHADEEQPNPPPEPKTSGSSPLHSAKRFSLTPLWRRSSVASPQTSPAPNSPPIDMAKDISEAQHVQAAQKESTGCNTLIDSVPSTTATDLSTADNISPQNTNDRRFEDVEKQYLGRFGHGITQP